MTTRIPVQAALYLDAVDRGDVDASLACLTTDATVIDEGNTYTGNAIKAWREASQSQYTFTREFRGLEPIDETHSVARYRLEGNFPGGVADLKFMFTTRADGLIERLEIAP